MHFGWFYVTLQLDVLKQPAAQLMPRLSFTVQIETPVLYSANKQHADPKTLLILSGFNEVNKTPQTKWDGAQTDGNNPSFLHASQR